MRFGFGLPLISLSLALVCALPPPAFSGDTTRAAQRDNSGRKIAVVVPLMPHSVQPVPIPSLRLHAGSPISNSISENLRRSDMLRRRVVSSISPSAALSPPVKEAVENGAMAAQGFSRIVGKRLNDIGTLIASLWQELNGIPRVTPNSPIVVSEPPPSITKPLAEWTRSAAKPTASR